MKTRARALCLCLAAVILCALPVEALGAVKQKSVTLSTKLITIDLAKGSTYQLSGAVNPKNASQRMVWRSSKTSVATISSSGLIRAKKIGTLTVGARPSSNKAWSKATVKIIDSLSPTSVSINVPSLNIAVGSTYQLTASAVPSTAAQSVRWLAKSSSIASVSSTGLVTAKKAGTTLIRAISTRNPKKYRTIKVTVKALSAPSRLTITNSTTTVEKGDQVQFSADIMPSTANPTVKWTSDNSAVASITSSGLLTARAVGTAKIKVYSSAKSSIYTVRTIKVVDTKTVTSVEIDSSSSTLFVGGSLTLSAEVLPATAPQTVTWSSNNASVASVSSSGVISGKAAGSATITVKAGSKTDTIRVVVQKATAVTEEPSQVTSVAGINANLAKIDDILRYATTQLDALYVSGAIDKDEMLERKTTLLNAFKMARFPWMSPKTIPYYTGSGYYRSNVVYFGAPYTQTNRNYTVDRLLDTNVYSKASDGNYYEANMPAKVYPGNDCSSFVSMSIWGLGTSYSFLNSTAMKASSAYRTIASSSNKAGYLNMRPGDVLVKNGHALMFLYFTNSAKTQVMIIQQGGFNTLSTVACDLKSLSYYSGNSAYVARRKSGYK